MRTEGGGGRGVESGNLQLMTESNLYQSKLKIQARIRVSKNRPASEGEGKGSNVQEGARARE